MKIAVLLSTLFIMNLAFAQEAEVSPLAKSAVGSCEQAQMAVATVQEAIVHLRGDNKTSNILAAENALNDTLYLTSQLSEKLCK